MNSLTYHIEALKSFTLSTQIQAQLRGIQTQLSLENRLNVKALCAVADIKEKTLNLTELNLKFREDYDIVSGLGDESDDEGSGWFVDKLNGDVVWNFEGRVSRDYAKRCKFGVLQLTANDEEFLFQLEDGDAAVSLIAYQALTFGAIDRRYLDLLIQKLPELSHLDNALSIEVHRILGISDCVS